MRAIYRNETGLAGSWLTNKDVDNIFELIERRGELIQRKNGKSVYRLTSEVYDKPLLVKTWCSNGLKSRVKYLTKIDNAFTEYRNKQYLKKVGVPSPELYYFSVSSSTSCSIIYFQVSEFVCTNTDAVQYIGELLANKNYGQVRDFSNKIILLTKDLLDVRFVDPDHRMSNLMVNESGEPVKIDLELASIMSNYRSYEKKIGKMVGTMIYSYIFAVYPHLEVAQEFSDSLIRLIPLSKCASKKAKALIDKVLAKEYADIGIDSRINLNFNM